MIRTNVSSLRGLPNTHLDAIVVLRLLNLLVVEVAVSKIKNTNFTVCRKIELNSV